MGSIPQSEAFDSRATSDAGNGIPTTSKTRQSIPSSPDYLEQGRRRKITRLKSLIDSRFGITTGEIKAADGIAVGEAHKLLIAGLGIYWQRVKEKLPVRGIQWHYFPLAGASEIELPTNVDISSHRRVPQPCGSNRPRINVESKIAELRTLIHSLPGISQIQIRQCVSGGNKMLRILKNGCGIHWREEKWGRSFCYFVLVSEPEVVEKVRDMVGAKPGTTLYDIIRAIPLPPDRVRQIMLQTKNHWYAKRDHQNTGPLRFYPIRQETEPRKFYRPKEANKEARLLRN